MQRKCRRCGVLFTPCDGLTYYCADCERGENALKIKGAEKTKVCPICKSTFVTAAKNKKYCSPSCRHEAQLQCAKKWNEKKKLEQSSLIQTVDREEVERMKIKDVEVAEIGDVKVCEVDMVNHPPHYKLASGRESIDIIREVLTPEEFKGFCKGSALKYQFRAGKKDPGKTAEDYGKAGFFLKKLGEM